MIGAIAAAAKALDSSDPVEACGRGALPAARRVTASTAAMSATPGPRWSMPSKRRWGTEWTPPSPMPGGRLPSSWVRRSSMRRIPWPPELSRPCVLPRPSRRSRAVSFGSGTEPRSASAVDPPRDAMEVRDGPAVSADLPRRVGDGCWRSMSPSFGGIPKSGLYLTDTRKAVSPPPPARPGLWIVPVRPRRFRRARRTARGIAAVSIRFSAGSTRLPRATFS